MNIFLADLVHKCGPRSFESDTVPYNIASIAAYTKSVMGDLVNFELFKYPEDLLAAIEKSRPDVVGFSNYIWNTHLVFTIGTFLREKYPDLLIVVGGPSVRTDREGMKVFLQKNPYVDLCIMNEGEGAFTDSVKAFIEHGKSFIDSKKELGNVAYLSNVDLVFNLDNNFVNFESTPSPYLLGYLDKFLEAGSMPIFESNRGCPFKCTFCAWGKAALNKVRKKTLEGLLKELDYVADKFPNISDWIIGDANFGMLKRDIDIAKKIQEIRIKNPLLKSITAYESKNTTDRTIEIAGILRGDGLSAQQVDFSLIALQSLDEKVLEYIKRSNIKQDDVPEKMAAYREAGTGLRTDVLSGLPGDTFDSHMNTLRKCFDYGFDHIGIYNVIILPGTEMETESSRKEYGIRTKFRLKDNAFGEYLLMKSIESEEIVVATDAINEEDLLTLRLLHWFIWYGWNHNFLKPILKYIHKFLDENPADILLKIITGDCQRSDKLAEAFDILRTGYSGEFFDTPEKLRGYYMEDGVWEKIKMQGLSRIGFNYNAKFINSSELFKDVLDAICSLIPGKAEADMEAMSSFLILSRVEPKTIVHCDIDIEKTVNVSSRVAQCIDVKGSDDSEHFDDVKHIILRKPLEHQEIIKNSLLDLSFDNNADKAIIRTIAKIPDAFVYEAAYIEQSKEK